LLEIGNLFVPVEINVQWKMSHPRALAGKDATLKRSSRDAPHYPTMDRGKY
jgi:hypothetical protein